MLQPTNRLTLIDAMRPPPGFGLEHALAVTYTIDLRALLGAPAAFALGELHNPTQTGVAADEPIELLHAVRRYTQRITVFNQVGAIGLPPSRKVFAFLEGCIVPVSAPRGGVVHPKVWILRYVPNHSDSQLPEAVHRVLIASRNLTFDESWDTIVRLDQTFAEHGAELEELADLFEGLGEHAQRPLTATERERVDLLAGELRQRRFAVPQGIDRLTVHTLGFHERPPVLPRHSDRSLVISPFLSDGFFLNIAPDEVCEVVSRAESFDSLGKAARDQILERLVFDDHTTDESNADAGDLSERDPGRPLRGLHAKVFVFEADGRARLFLGSANATTAAFTKNVEVLLECEGDLAAIGIDALLGEDGGEDGLRRLLVTHSDTALDESETEPLEIDEVRRLIAAAGIRGVVEQSGDGWATTYVSRESLPNVEGMTIHCWPLSIEGSRRVVSGGEPLAVRFEVTIESISGFLAVEIQLEEIRTAFVVPVELEGIPSQRETALMKALIGNAERFFRYLLAFLDDDLVDAVDTRTVVDRIGAQDDGEVVQGLPVLERLLRTVRRDPEKLRGLNPLVHDLSADDILPVGFLELWALLEHAVRLRTGDPR